jgi:antitoxin CptB
MREMDILLTRFLDRGYGDLDEAEQSAFERLLDLPDQDLLAWLSGKGAPDDVQLGALLERIRQVVEGP